MQRRDTNRLYTQLFITYPFGKMLYERVPSSARSVVDFNCPCQNPAETVGPTRSLIPTIVRHSPWGNHVRVVVSGLCGPDEGLLLIDLCILS